MPDEYKITYKGGTTPAVMPLSSEYGWFFKDTPRRITDMNLVNFCKDNPGEWKVVKVTKMEVKKTVIKEIEEEIEKEEEVKPYI